MSVRTFLSSVEARVKSYFVDAAKVIEEGDKVAAEVEPFVDAALPGAAPLYNAIVAEVGTIETAAIAAGAQSGTGTQKLAAVLASPTVQAAVSQFATTAGVSPLTQTQVTNYVRAVVATLNALPSTPAAPAAAPVSSQTVGSAAA